MLDFPVDLTLLPTDKMLCEEAPLVKSLLDLITISDDALFTIQRLGNGQLNFQSLRKFKYDEDNKIPKHRLLTFGSFTDKDSFFSDESKYCIYIINVEDFQLE